VPNGDELNEQLEFEERMKAMPPDDRTIFIAKQTYALANKFDAMDKKFTDLDTKFDNFNGTGVNKKTVATTSGITSAIIVGIIEGIKLIIGKG